MPSDDSVLRNGGSHSGQPSSGGLPGPLRLPTGTGSPVNPIAIV